MDDTAECAVCHQPIPKGRVHYGGVSCYSCRAFFRRNTQRDELPVCKVDGACTITYQDRKQCSSCRYGKCISIGMRPELVLTEDEKKRRFKKFLKKKEEEASNIAYSPEPKLSNEDSIYERDVEMPPLEPIESNMKAQVQLSNSGRFNFPLPTPSSSPYHRQVYHQNMRDREAEWFRLQQKSTRFVPNMMPDVSHRTSLRGISPTYTSPQDYSTPTSSKIPLKDSPRNSCMPTPPASPEQQIPSAFPNALKDVEAWRYFASKGLIARNIFSQMTMNSPDNRKQFSVAPNNTELYIRPTIPELIPYNIKKEDCFEAELSVPSDYSKYRLDQRPSVITSSSINQSRVGDQVERPKMIKIKEEKPDEYTEENNTPSDHLESTPTSSSKVYLPESYSFTSGSESSKNNNECDDLIFKYVHKKFRTHTDNSTKNDNSCADALPQKRKSVIFHASGSKKICVE